MSMSHWTILLLLLLVARYIYKNGRWNEGELVDSPYVNIHVNSNVLHYGQALFEGLKAFHGADGKVRVLNPLANARRLNHGCRRLCMPEVPEEMFLESLDRVINDNVDHIPPYGRQQTLYLRYASGRSNVCGPVHSSTSTKVVQVGVWCTVSSCECDCVLAGPTCLAMVLRLDWPLRPSIVLLCLSTQLETTSKTDPSLRAQRL